MDVLARFKSHYLAVLEKTQTIVTAVPAATWLLTPVKHNHWEFKGKKSPGVSWASMVNQGFNW